MNKDHIRTRFAKKTEKHNKTNGLCTFPFLGKLRFRLFVCLKQENIEEERRRDTKERKTIKKREKYREQDRQNKNI